MRQVNADLTRSYLARMPLAAAASKAFKAAELMSAALGGALEDLRALRTASSNAL